jgi:hypothetical protein
MELMLIEDPTDLKRGLRQKNKHSTVMKQKWEMATQLLEESVPLRIMTVEDFRTVQVKKRNNMQFEYTSIRS